MTVVRLNTRVQIAWEAYLDARARAERTGAIEDGMAAGRAWSNWLHLFLTPEQRAAIPERVERLP